MLINCCSHLNIVCLNLADCITKVLEYFLFNDFLNAEYSGHRCCIFRVKQSEVRSILSLSKAYSFDIQRRQRSRTLCKTINLYFKSSLHWCLLPSVNVGRPAGQQGPLHGSSVLWTWAAGYAGALRKTSRLWQSSLFHQGLFKPFFSTVNSSLRFESNGNHSTFCWYPVSGNCVKLPVMTTSKSFPS